MKSLRFGVESRNVVCECRQSLRIGSNCFEGAKRDLVGVLYATQQRKSMMTLIKTDQRAKEVIKWFLQVLRASNIKQIFTCTRKLQLLGNIKKRISRAP